MSSARDAIRFGRVRQHSTNEIVTPFASDHDKQPLPPNNPTNACRVSPAFMKVPDCSCSLMTKETFNDRRRPSHEGAFTVECPCAVTFVSIRFDKSITWHGLEVSPGGKSPG